MKICISDTISVAKLVGKRLQKARKDKNLSRQAFCDIVNTRDDRPIRKGCKDTVNIERLIKWEIGENPIALEWIPSICSELHIDVGYLFGEYEEHTREISDATKVTGLSADSINVLLYMDKPSKSIIDCLIQEYSGERYRIFTSINGAADAQIVMNHDHNNESLQNQLALFSLAFEISTGIKPATGYAVPTSAEDIKDLNLDRAAREFRLFAKEFAEKVAKELEERLNEQERTD